MVFVCVLLVNSLYAETTYRAREFGQQRLTGATPGQVLGTVGVEGAILTATAIFFGTAAGLAGIIPFTTVRTDAVLPGQGLGIWVAIVAVGVAATLGTSVSDQLNDPMSDMVSGMGSAHCGGVAWACR